MTTPNLDALAKLAPFTAVRSWGGSDFTASDGSDVDGDDVLAALNDWAELRTEKALMELFSNTNAKLVSENAELRAERERTKQVLWECWQWFDDHDDRAPRFELHRMLKDAVREPGQGAT